MDGSSIGPGEAEVYPDSSSEEPYQENEEFFERPAYHPSAPPHEIFDISTTVDPSYIISLIRKLLPLGNSNQCQGILVHDTPKGGPRTENGGKDTVSQSNCEEFEPQAGRENGVRDTSENFGEGSGPPGLIDDLQHERMHLTFSEGEAAWEEHGCTLWDLAASETHAELMVQNLILEVILVNLRVSQSARAIEISLGIMGNLACHEVSRKQILSTNGLVEATTDQLFLDDARCLCEAFRLISLCLQGGESLIWAEALSPERILSRILWIAENTLNLELIEKSVGLLMTIGSQKDIATVLLPPLMKLGLPSLLINLFSFEMSKLTEMPERYPILDIVLQVIEVLSGHDDFSSCVCPSKELFSLLSDLIKFPDKTEVGSSCVIAAVLVANILSDVEHLACELSQDMDFLRGIFDIVPCASDDIEAKSALWSILARLLDCVKFSELNLSYLHQYISIFVGHFNMIEEELVNLQFSETSEDSQSFTSNVDDQSARSRILRGIFDVLNQWRLLEARAKEAGLMEENFANKDVDKLLDKCCELIKCQKPSSVA